MRLLLAATASLMLTCSALAQDAAPEVQYDDELRGSFTYAGTYYVKGQVGYVWTDINGVTFEQGGSTATFDSADVDNTWTLGAGAGYHFTELLRGELMFNYYFNSDFVGSTTGGCSGVLISPCVSADISSWDAYQIMASLYVDIVGWSFGVGGGTVTPFVGGGIGGTYVNWDNLSNTNCEQANPNNCDGPYYHEGGSEWRTTYQVTLGAAYDFSCRFVGEASYQYSWINGGYMFGEVQGGGPGWDDGFGTQQVNLGLRYYPGRECYVPPIIYKG